MMSRRKLRIALLLVWCLVAGNTLAQSLVPIDPGTVSDGHVYLLEDASDSSPNGNTGNLIGDPQVVDGLSGKAMQFNGTSDGVHVPDSALINTAIHQNQTVIAVFNCSDVTKTEKQCVFEEGGTTRGLNIYVYAGLVYAGGWNPADYTPQWSPGTFLSAPIGSNEWHVVAAVLRGGGAGQEDDKFEMWMDGKLIGKGPGAELRARSDDNGIAHVVGQSKFHDGNASAGGWWFEGLIDEVWILDHALTDSELAAIAPNQGGAKSPVPANGMDDILRDSGLSWTPGKYAVKHHLYLGETLEQVDATTTPLAVLDANTYDPGRLEFGKTYYWRVDEVNGAPDNTVFKGEVWSFQAEPYSIMIPVDVNRVTASSFTDANPPSMTVNGSGLNGMTHSTGEEEMWLSGALDLSPWLMYEFNSIEKLDQMLIWNSNSTSEAFIGWGIMDVNIEYSIDGVAWTPLAGSTQIARASGLPTYDQPQAIDFGSVPAKYVRIDILNNWGGILKQYGVSEVQFYGVPVFARTPVPADGTADVRPDAMATWRAGREAAQHTLSVSQDPNAISDGSAASASSMTNSVDLGSFDLQMGTTYYWKVDEVNDVEVPSLWAGPVWSFGTVASLIVDDFESYSNLSPNRPFQTWHDGYGYSADEYFPDYPGNGTGSGIGHDIWGPSSPYFNGSIMETGRAMAGSSQSMPFYYSNTGGTVSQTERTFATPQDWTVGGAQTLSIAFSGQTGNTGTLYIKINDTKLTYQGDPENLTLAVWQTWNIDLASVNTNLQNITKLQIGVEGSGATGMILIDDLRLHAEAGQVITPMAPGSTHLIGAWNFDEGSGTVASDNSGNGHTGAITGATWDTGTQGSALLFAEADYVETGFPGVTGTGPRTYTAWIKTVTADRTFLACGLNTVGNKWRIRLDATGGLRVEVNGGYHYGQAFLADDEWHHTAVVLDDDGTPDVSETRLYVDGLPETAAAILSTAIDTDPTGEFRIGMATYDTVGFIGLIDDVRVYDRALSDGEVRSLAGRTTAVDKPF